MLKDLFGDTPQVEAIEKIIKSNDDWHRFFSKEEIINDLGISKETLDGFDEDFLKLVYLAKYKLSDIYEILTLKDDIDRILPEKPSFRKEYGKVSKNYQLYEEEYVKMFFTERYGLVSYVNHITPIINSYFKSQPKMIVFNPDPEIDSLSRITIYIKSCDEETLKELKKELRNCDLFPNDIKFRCSVKLDCHEWYFNNADIDESYLRYCDFYGDSNEKIFELF